MTSPFAVSAVHLACRRLPVFERKNWDEVFAAFADSQKCEYGQHWLPALEAQFLPGCVRTGFDEEALWILAEFEDCDIFNAATKWNQDTHRLGDVFEIFLEPNAGGTYFEFHISPENQRLQLEWPRAQRWPKDAQWKSRTLLDSQFESWTRVLHDENRWQVLVQIPFEKLGWSTPETGASWRFSFGRYDYTRNTLKPILSSTSHHCESDFHRLHEWGSLYFEA